MKSFHKIMAAVTAVMIIIFIGANLYLFRLTNQSEGRPYRVEISRLALQIESGGLESVDWSQCEYVKHIEKRENNAVFFDTGSDYIIKEIAGELYRFDYSVNSRDENAGYTFTVNAILGIMAAVVFLVLFFVRQKILRPFERLTDVPYELAKGNLTAPIKESKNRFFGRFLWGVDLLRENMEEQKQRELDLQKSKKTLILSISHDIKTPLSAIKLYAKALSKGLYEDKEKQCEIAENINAKADEIEGFVSQIINASREDFLNLELDMGEFYLSTLMNNITGYYREKLALIKTDFTVEEYDDCLLKGDIDRGIEVLQNIIENAIKYGDGRSISIRIQEEDNCKLIQVQNSGCTLSDSELPHIFESFWRGSNSAHSKGSGLGLYICRQLMHKMGGEIFAQMKDGAMIVTAVFVEV